MTYPNESNGLHHAARHGQPEEITALIEAGADINAQDERGRTPLHAAADGEEDTSDNIETLLDAGANPLIRDKHSHFPFDFADENDGLKGTDALKRLYWALHEADEAGEDVGGNWQLCPWRKYAMEAGN